MPRARTIPIAVIATLVAIIVAIVLYYPFSPIAVQGRNMAAVEQHLPFVKTALASDPRFAQVTAEAFTDRNGCLILNGVVATEADRDDLLKLIEATRPPRPIKLSVAIDPHDFPTADGKPPTSRLTTSPYRNDASPAEQERLNKLPAGR